MEIWLPRDTAMVLSQLETPGSSRGERISVADIVALGLRQRSRDEAQKARAAQKRVKMDAHAQRALVSDLRAQGLSWEKIAERLNGQMIGGHENWTVGKVMKLFG